MSQEEPNSLDTAPNADLRARFDQGIGNGAEKLTALQAAHGFAGSFTLTFLIASAFFPLLLPAAAGGAAGSVAVAWLSGLGCNVLAGWLTNWAERGIGKLRLEDKAQEQQLIQELAAGLEGQLASNEALQGELAILLEQTDGIATAIDSLALQSDAQAKLMEALRDDARQTNLIQGRLHRVLIRQLNEAENRIITKIEAEHSFTRQIVQAEAQSTKAHLERISAEFVQLNSILRAQVSTETSQSTDKVQGIVEAQIDAARDLIQAGHYVAARKSLVRLREQHNQSEVAPESRARIANLLGCCAFEMGELQVAQTYFNEAVVLAPSNIGMLANDAMVALQSDKPERALELSTRAYALDRKDPHVSAIYIQALHRMNRQEELEEVINSEPSLTEHAIILAALGMIKYELGAYDEAEALLRRAIALDPTDPQLYILLANRILVPLTTEPFEIGQLDNQNNEQLTAAEEAFGQAIALYEQRDNRESLHAALVSRAGIRCAQGHLEAGLADCERVLSDDARHKGALENKGRILLNLHRTGEAIRCLEELLHHPAEEHAELARYKVSFIGGRKPNIPALLGSAYIDAEQFTKAIALLSPLFKPTPDDRDQLDIAEVLLVAHSNVYDTTAVAETLRIIEETWPQDSEAKAVVADHLARQGKRAEAITLLQEAAELTNGFLRSRLTARIAYILYQEKQYAEAADVLRPIVDTQHDNPDLRLYITCLYNSQQFGEALPLAQHIRATTGIVPGIAEIEALILEKGGHVQQAREIWQQLIQAQPANMSHRVNAAYTEWRAGNREAAQRVTLGIPYDTVISDSFLSNS